MDKLGEGKFFNPVKAIAATGDEVVLHNQKASGSDAVMLIETIALMGWHRAINANYDRACEESAIDFAREFDGGAA